VITMKLSVECYSSRRADERPVRFWLEGRQYQGRGRTRPSGTTRRGSSTKSEYKTEISAFSDSKHPLPTGVGIDLISPRGRGALTRVAMHRTQDSVRRQVHQQQSERLRRFQGKPAGPDNAAEILPDRARRPLLLQASSPTP
jgi:hypothetical protein